jgi:hypothetical protein
MDRVSFELFLNESQLMFDVKEKIVFFFSHFLLSRKKGILNESCLWREVGGRDVYEGETHPYVYRKKDSPNRKIPSHEHEKQFFLSLHLFFIFHTFRRTLKTNKTYHGDHVFTYKALFSCFVHFQCHSKYVQVHTATVRCFLG